MKHREELERFYENEGLEELRLQEDGAQYQEYLTATRYLDHFLHPDSVVLDNCAGTGAYSFYLAKRGHRVTAGDIVPYNVEIIRQKQRQNPILKEIFCGDAGDIPTLSDESFDAVLCMGALYHLPDAKERAQVMREGIRLLKSGGLFMFTYMNRYAVILNNLSGDLDDMDGVMDFLSHGKEGIFYTATPAEMEQLTREYGLGEQCHVALDGMATFLRYTSERISDGGLKRLRQYHEAVCEDPSLLGYGYHNMIIAQKP